MYLFRRFRFPAAAILCVLSLGNLPAAEASKTAESAYTTGVKTRDGLGKYYFGREIASYMTHEGAPWLDRPERDQEERPDLVLQALQLKPGDLVADVGCGTGYFSWRMAQAVAPGGVVYGEEIQPEMLDFLRRRSAELKVTNIEPHLGAIDDLKLPANSLDAALMVQLDALRKQRNGIDYSGDMVSDSMADEAVRHADGLIGMVEARFPPPPGS